MNPRLGVGDLEASDGVGGGAREDISLDVYVGKGNPLTGLLIHHFPMDGECLCGSHDAGKDEEAGEPESSFHVCLDLVLFH